MEKREIVISHDIFNEDCGKDVEEGRHPSKRARPSSLEPKGTERIKRRHKKHKHSVHAKFRRTVDTADTGMWVSAPASVKGCAVGEDWPGSTEWYNQTAIGTYVRAHRKDKLKVIDFSSTVDKTLPTVYENASKLKCETPGFRASATIQMAPMVPGERWKVGFIQALTDPVTELTFGRRGCLSWEFPEIKNGIKMVNDSYGHHYPWYGPNEETVVFEGPCDKYQSATIEMSDAPDAPATWRFSDPSNNEELNLSNVFRDTTFKVWLVALNMSNNEAYVLKMVRWNMRLNVDVDPKKKLGRKTTIRGDSVPTQPLELIDVPIPNCALLPPCANSSQEMVWRPRKGRAISIFPPDSVPVEVQLDIDPRRL